jgi:hypothetical protein
MAEEDASYKQLFSHERMVADLIRGFVHEAWVQELDFATLERLPAAFITDDLRRRDSDLLWRVKLGPDWIYVYVLVEFQSRIDRDMALRVLVYCGLLLQDLIRRGEVASGGPYPPVLPLVVYNGEAPWTAATCLSALRPELPDELARHQLDAAYILIDEGRLPAASLPAEENLAGLIVRLERAANFDDAQRWLIALWSHFASPEMTPLRRALSTWVRRLVAPALGADQSRLLETVIHLEDTSMLRYALVREMDQARAQGRQEGRQEGIAGLLIRQLTRRFGPPSVTLEQRILGATLAEIEVWADRILDAAALDDVFDA